ncbi:MAG: glycosyltransferase [Alphaproteobacteria bacterium]|nr:glycosyltransferase [Alphaproteobacteria bacterium]
MSKPHLILWGGSWEPLNEALTPENIDSHAKVSYVFLKEALSAHFDVTGIDEFDKIGALELRKDTLGVLSTFQAGFTQLREKRPALYQKIAPLLCRKKFSILDETTGRRTCEDKLFTVIPPDYALKNKLQNFLSPSRAYHMGWCASPAYCYPQEDQTFTVFVDHGHYAGDDYTDVVMQALRSLDADVRVFIQGNDGVMEWDLSQGWRPETYQRANKVPWAQMMSYYRRAHLFCLTHKESAGLSSIEAAMSGARLVIPHLNGQAFLHEGLLQPPLDFKLVACDVEALRTCFEEQIQRGVDKQANHKALKEHSSWDQAAQRIYDVLAGIK